MSHARPPKPGDTLRLVNGHGVERARWRVGADGNIGRPLPPEPVADAVAIVEGYARRIGVNLDDLAAS